jgi:hypothetical protein
MIGSLVLPGDDVSDIFISDSIQISKFSVARPVGRAARVTEALSG